MRGFVGRLERVEHARALRADAERECHAEAEPEERADARVERELLAGFLERDAVAFLKAVEAVLACGLCRVRKRAGVLMLEVLLGEVLELLAGVAAEHGKGLGRHGCGGGLGVWEAVHESCREGGEMI